MDKKYIVDTIKIGAETHKDISNFMSTEEFAELPVLVQALYVASANSLAALVVSCQGIEFSLRKDEENDFDVVGGLTN